MENYLNGKIKLSYTARIVAGFCWPWSDPDRFNNLVADVKVGNWERPWNAKAINNSYPPDKHPYFLWANRMENQLGEVGCIYSVQGFEFDYIGVIWGNDLVWRTDKWVAQPEKSFDGEMKSISQEIALKLLKNAYRVLSSRGLRGCSFVFLDEETRNYMEKSLSQK